MAWGAPAWSAGFALVQQGTAAMGQGNAFVAEANDPSAIFYNPAGLNQLKRTEAYSATIFNYPSWEFNGFIPSETEPRLLYTAAAYVAGPVTDRVALGLGFFSPFGLSSKWPDSWVGRYISTFSKLSTYDINPVVSVKVLDNLSLAAGVNLFWSAPELKRNVPLAPGVDAEVALNAGGMGWGYNLGALYEPVSGVKLGAHFRSAITVVHEGDLTLNVPGILIKGSSKITFPPSVTFGTAYSRLQPWTFLFDVTWTGWSSFDKLKVDLNTPLFGAFSLVTPKDWHDAWAFRFGVNYEIMPGVKLRAGYIYDMTPVPNHTFDPQLPDANRHVFTVGKEFTYKRVTLGAAYNYILFEGRTKNNVIATNGVPAPLQANGPYASDAHSLGVSASFKF